MFNRLRRSTIIFCAFVFVLSHHGFYKCGFAKSPESSSEPMKLQEKSAEVVVKAKLNYLISLPDNYDQQNEHPLLLFLHGAGERGDGELDRVKIHGPTKLIAQGKKFPCVVVAPQCPSNRWWDATELSGLLDHIEANYKIDTNRIYVTGLSMGGYGTWALAMREPDRFAAIAPVCGGGNSRAIKYIDKITAPIWAFHGAKDTVIPLEKMYEMQKALEEQGIEMRVTVYPEVGHNSWDNAYADDELFEWLFSHSRE